MANTQQQTFQAQKEKALSLFHSSIKFAQQQQNNSIEKRLLEARTRLEKGQLFVVVCGEFKEGKSSLINAFLNESSSDLFPVDMDIATCLVSTICYAEQEKIAVIVGESGKEEKKIIKRSQINDYVNEQHNKKNVRQAKLLSIETPNFQLQEGLVLVDTPGVGGINAQHTGITYAYIPQADAVLFINDVQSPLQTSELKFLQFIIKNCPDVTDNIVFVVTKKDLKKKEECDAIVESNREKAAEFLQRAKEDVPVIAVSSHNKRRYLTSQNERHYANSNFKELEEAIWRLINQNSGYKLVMRSVHELEVTLSEMKMPLETEIKALQQHGQEEVQKLERQLQGEKQRLQELLSNNTAWQKELYRGLNDIGDDASSQLRYQFIETREFADDCLENKNLVNNPDAIIDSLEADIDAKMLALGNQVSRQAEKLQSKIERNTGLRLNVARMRDLDWDKPNVTLDDLNVTTSSAMEKTWNVAKGTVYNVSAGSMVGALLGGAVGSLLGGVGAAPGAIIGAKIGALFGGFSGAGQTVSQVVEKDFNLVKQKLSKKIYHFITQSETRCTHGIKDIVKELERSMEDQLTIQIKQQKDVFERSLKSMEDSKQLTYEQATQRAKELTIPRETLNNLLKQTDELAKAAITLKESSTKIGQKGAESSISSHHEEWADG